MIERDNASGFTYARPVVLAFFKRRWMLLSCAVVIVACSLIDLTRTSHIYYSTAGRMRPLPVSEHGISNGTIHMYDYFGSQSTDANPTVLFAVHHPHFGTTPKYGRGGISPAGFHLAVPLWLPLSAVLGWIVFRELRWREKWNKPHTTQL